MNEIEQKTFNTVAHISAGKALSKLIPTTATMGEIPSQFDVIVTENMFGDILSDEGCRQRGSTKGATQSDAIRKAHIRQNDK